MMKRMLFLATLATLTMGATSANDGGVDRVSAEIVDYMVARGGAGTRVVRDAAYRETLVLATYDAAETHEIPPELLLAMMFHESSFRSWVTGSRGELGLLQVGGLGRRICRCHEMALPSGQIDCGACWLKVARDECSTLEGALTMYTSGACTTTDPHVSKIVEKRLNLWRKLSN